MRGVSVSSILLLPARREHLVRFKRPLAENWLLFKARIWLWRSTYNTYIYIYLYLSIYIYIYILVYI